MPFKSLGLSDPLVQGILATGYTAPTEIQSRAIPVGLTGKDVIGAAQTGTGKTAAFVLPLLQHLSKPSDSHARHQHCRALILTPTRELAQQIEDAVIGYGRFLHLKTLSVYGGANMQSQMKHLQRGVDIVVATPGRLLDHLERRSINLSSVQVLVIDEADRMFDMGFINDVKKIISFVPRERQTMMFAATMSKPVRDLMSAAQKHPVLIEIGERRLPVESVRQFFYSAPAERKIDLLFFMLEAKEMDSVLIFSRTKHGADKISRKLERQGVKSIAIHSNRTQAQRQQALAGFKQGQYRVLVATDVAARGIDVEGISHVVNYDIPNFPEDYIHRIGRTGRASATGDAITFVGREEIKHLKALERFTGKHYELKKYPGYDYDKKLEAPAPHQPGERKHEGERREQRPYKVKFQQGARRDNRDNRSGEKRFSHPKRSGPKGFSTEDRRVGEHRSSDDRRGGRGSSRTDQRGGRESKQRFSNDSPGPYDKDKKEKPYYAKFVPPPAAKKDSDWRKLIDEMNNRFKKVKSKIKGSPK
jgi:ATP-dependent RNA helicase RhlE